MFQLINPKGLVMSITVMSTFISLDFDFTIQFFILVISFVVITFLSVITWAWFGIVISQFLAQINARTFFNVTMAVLLVASIMPVAFDMIS